RRLAVRVQPPPRLIRFLPRGRKGGDNRYENARQDQRARHGNLHARVVSGLHLETIDRRLIGDTERVTRWSRGEWMKARHILFGMLAIAIGGSVGANERISMRVSPEVSFAPANLSVRTTVEAHPDNRWIEIIAESDDFYRSSEMQLDGEHAPRTTIFASGSLPGGTY